MALPSILTHGAAGLDADPAIQYNTPVSQTDYRLPRGRRLRNKKDIDRAFRRGRSASVELLRVHAAKNGRTESRVAISCPRRIGSSVARNRWKRLIREAFRLNRESLGSGLDIVVVPLKGPRGVKRQDVEASLRQAVRKIRSRGT